MKFPVAFVAVLLLAFLMLGLEVYELAYIESVPSMSESLANFQALSIETPCTGIVSFYSGEGFLSDIGRAWVRYDEIYDADWSYIDSESTLYPPGAMIYGPEGYDCEDFAHLTYCLAGMYPGITCRPYASAVTPEEGHLGMVCIVSENNQTYEVKL